MQQLILLHFLSKWQLAFLSSPHFAVFLSPPFPAFADLTESPPLLSQPPYKSNRVLLEARQLFADQLALLRLCSHTNSHMLWSVCLGLTIIM